MLLHHGLVAFFNAIASIGYVNIATYVNKVRHAETHCECAQDWRQDFMFVFAIIFAIISIVYVFLVASDAYSKIAGRYPYLNTIMTLCTAVYIAISYSYTRRLESIGCSCSKDVQVMLIQVIHLLNGLFVTYGIIFFLAFFAVTGGALWYATTSKAR